ncbi:MAG: hypothetical protein AAGA03_11800, partial [Planctomycetota bacterium]
SRSATLARMNGRAWAIAISLLALSLVCCDSISLSAQVDRESALATDLDSRSIDENVQQQSDAPDSNEPVFDVQQVAATSAWADSLGIADWLGPLAPVALSPLLGVNIRSGHSRWGPEWVTDNAMLGSSGPLKSPVLFSIFLALTVATSIPRFTKVSKPFAQAVDRVEAYAVVIILLIIKLIAGADVGEAESLAPAVVQLGVFSFTANTLLAVAMVINVLVINSVKFFFEFLVWVTPIPAVDAVFEVCNKSLCAGLMMIYAISPLAATCVNLVLFVIALILFRWISRRVRFYRTISLDPILSFFWKGYSTPKSPQLIVFPESAFGRFPAKSRLQLTFNTDKDGWTLREANWWMPERTESVAIEHAAELKRGFLMHTLLLRRDGRRDVFHFSRRHDPVLVQLAGELNLTIIDELPESVGERVPVT